jgi:hypothetical protein
MKVIKKIEYVHDTEDKCKVSVEIEEFSHDYDYDTVGSRTKVYSFKGAGSKKNALKTIKELLGETDE